MILTLKAHDVQELYARELAKLQDWNLRKIGNRSNNNGGIHKCAFMVYLLDAVDADTVFTVENCNGDGRLRDFCLANAGSIVECLVKAILDHEGNAEYTKAWVTDEADAINGCMEWEIKASLDSHYLATPAKGNRVTVLINRSGVSVIRKTEVQNYVNSRGRLPHIGLFGKRNNFMVRFLENALGIEGGFEEA